MIIQDPYQSLAPTMRVASIVAEPLRIRGRRDAVLIAAEVREALEAVRLPADPAFLARHPATLSGGQRQRVAFALALVTRPALIVADEPTSMLDQSVRLSILALMEELRRRQATSFLFITHDMILARHFCDRLLVMEDGAIVEAGPPEAIVFAPRHPYTRALIAAVTPDADLTAVAR
jgi:ABC-type glutathione transport system ATPase component